MQKYEKSAVIYYLPREGRILVKNDMASLATVKSKNYGGQKIISYDRKIMRMFFIMAKFFITTS